MQRPQFLNIFLVVFIVLVGIGLIMPLMPFFAAKYGANEFMVGLLVASYAAGQFIGAPLFGRLSDHYGRRPILAISMAGTMVGFLFLGLAETIGTLYGLSFSGDSLAEQTHRVNSSVLGIMYFSQILSGLAGGSITVAQAFIADITDETSRMKGMGLIGAAFGLGFIVGPVIGGFLSQWGFAIPSYAAAALTSLSLLNILFRLPESLTEARKAELAQQKKQPLISFSVILKRMGQPLIGPLLIIRLVSALAGSLFLALFTLWAKFRLGLDAQVTAYLMAYTGALSIVTQIWLIGPLTRRYSQAVLMNLSIAILAGALLAWAFTDSVAVLMVVMIPHSIATGVLFTVVNSATSWAVPPQEMGDALGTSSALDSLSRVVAPPVGGWLLGAVGGWGPGVLGAVLMVGLTVYAWQRLIVHPDPPLILVEQG